MKILFSPSELKCSQETNDNFDNKSFLFEDLYELRKEILIKYNNFLSTASKKELEKIFGIKKEELINLYKKDIFKKSSMKAILRYQGVAYEYLNYNNLSKEEQQYIDRNVLIFSNLFGPIRAIDKIPDYKLKQGETFSSIKIEKYYCDYFSSTLDDYFKDEDILDLRAGFYEKFYQIKQPYMTMKFVKNGKVVSHWAKAYRGIILANLAKNNINSLEDVANMNIENLYIEEIKKNKNTTQIVYNIINI